MPSDKTIHEIVNIAELAVVGNYANQMSQGHEQVWHTEGGLIPLAAPTGDTGHDLAMQGGHAVASWFYLKWIIFGAAKIWSWICFVEATDHPEQRNGWIIIWLLVLIPMVLGLYRLAHGKRTEAYKAWKQAKRARRRIQRRGDGWSTTVVTGHGVQLVPCARPVPLSAEEARRAYEEACKRQLPVIEGQSRIILPYSASK